MPFYLVTQTSLIEADDAESAASAVLVNICSNEKVAFTVKLDDANISHVSVSLPRRDQGSTDAEKVVEPFTAKVSDPDAPVQPPQLGDRPSFPISARIFVLVLAAASAGLVSGLMLA